MLSGARKFLTLLPLILLLGTGLLLFFVILSGASSSSTLLSKFYWLKAETSGLGNYSVTKWTNYRLCSGSGTTSCGSATAGLPISPEDNFGNSNSLPSTFISSRDSFYYESKVGFAFLLIGTFFTILAILLSLPALCASSTVLVSFAMLVSIAAFVFIAVSAALYTNVVVKAKNAFQGNGMSASVGKKMMAFMWASVLMLILVPILFLVLGCCQFAANRRSHHDNYNDKEYAAGGAAGVAGAGAYDSDDDTYDENRQSGKNRAVHNVPFWKRSTNKANATTEPVAAAGNANATDTTEPSKVNFFRVRNNRNEAQTADTVPETTTTY